MLKSLSGGMVKYDTTYMGISKYLTKEDPENIQSRETPLEFC